MKSLEHPFLHAVFLGLMSFVYAFLFIFTSTHLEFTRQINHDHTLNNNFWNNWSNFILNGNMKYIGYLIIILTLIIFILIITKKIRKYDEYQTNILSRSLIIAGLLSVIMIPFMMIMILSDINYSIETVFLFATIQWLGVLIAYLYFVIKN